MKQIDYNYHNLPVPGGGYVTGFIFHPVERNLMYCRTDIGGCYRYNFENNSWESLADHIKMTNLSECYPTAFALDTDNPSHLYIACGVSRFGESNNGVFCISHDYGKTFSYKELPIPVHGNWQGRGCGFRLVLYNGIFYFANQRGGLLRSTDYGDTWESIFDYEDNTTFVWAYKKTIVVGTAGINHIQNQMRGHSLYVSYDEGKTFCKLSMPESVLIPEIEFSGLVGHRYDFDGKYLYVTLSATGPMSYSFRYAEGFSCDSGDASCGKIIRYSVDDNGILSDYEDITPYGTIFNYTQDGINSCGFGGICSTPQVPGLLVTSTLCERGHDTVFVSKDYGNSWEISLSGLDKKHLKFNTSYMKPEYNGNNSLIHWISDIKINPFDCNNVFFNTGTGIFSTKDLLSEDHLWQDVCDGLEETVHMNVYSPHSGDVKVIDLIGDLGGFAFSDIYHQCENTFADENNDRYITCLNADYSDIDPSIVIVTPRGNWSGKTKGGLIISKDQCKTFTHLDMPFGISTKINRCLNKILQPNQNSGWVAMSPNCQNIVWAIADDHILPIDCVVYSNNGGATFGKSSFYDLNNTEVVDGGIKVYSDRIKDNVMYGFMTSRRFFISKDAGKNFYEVNVESPIPEFYIGLLWSVDYISICPEHGKSGVFYFTHNEYGIWKLIFDTENNSMQFIKLSTDDMTIYSLGLGINKDTDYLTANKAIYLAGIVDGEYGFYRSCDDCQTFTRINNDNQMFGQIGTICGDSRNFGVFYIATGTRGLVCGMPAREGV